MPIHPVSYINTRRCVNRYPSDLNMMCVLPEPVNPSPSHRPHTQHTAWGLDGLPYSWETPRGPQTDEEWLAAAWEMSGALGIKVTYDEDDGWLRVDHDDLARWWDRDDRSDLISFYRNAIKSDA